MRHNKRKYSIGSSPSHRKSLMRNLAIELIDHGRIRTTHTKCKAIKPFIEKLVTIAKVDTVANRRLAFKKLNNKAAVGTLFSTVAVSQGMPFHSSISTAKAGIEGLTKSLAAEFAPKVRVNCIAPTLTKTDLAKGILRNERIEENISEKHPLKKICEASDVSGMVNFLVSRDAKMVTGQIMRVDSGMSTLKI